MSHPHFPGLIVHREYRYYKEHVDNIFKNPRHEARHMGIKPEEFSQEELIWECFKKLVLCPCPDEIAVNKNT